MVTDNSPRRARPPASPPAPVAESLADDRALLEELEPEAGPPLRPPPEGRPGVVPPRLHPVPARARLRQGALDARPAAPDRRRPDRVRGQPPDRGQPALVPPADPRDVRPGRRRVDQLDRPLDGRGGPPRDRPARLPDGDPQPRPDRPRARPDDAAPAGLRPRLDRHAARPRLRRLPGARDPDLAQEHRALLAGPGRRPDHDPDRGRREPPHGVLPRHPRRGAEDPAVAGGPGDRRRGPRVRDARQRHPRLPAQGRGDREGRASTTSGSTATRS